MEVMYLCELWSPKSRSMQEVYSGIPSKAIAILGTEISWVLDDFCHVGSVTCVGGSLVMKSTVNFEHSVQSFCSVTVLSVHRELVGFCLAS